MLMICESNPKESIGALSSLRLQETTEGFDSHSGRIRLTYERISYLFIE